MAPNLNPLLQCGITSSALISSLYLDAQTADVFFTVVSPSGERERIPAHKSVLIAKSEVFESILNGPIQYEGDLNVVGVAPVAFKEFLQLFYNQIIIINTEYISDVKKLCSSYLDEEYIDLAYDFIENNLTMNANQVQNQPSSSIQPTNGQEVTDDIQSNLSSEPTIRPELSKEAKPSSSNESTNLPVTTSNIYSGDYGDLLVCDRSAGALPVWPLKQYFIPKFDRNGTTNTSRLNYIQAPMMGGNGNWQRNRGSKYYFDYQMTMPITNANNPVDVTVFTSNRPVWLRDIYCSEIFDDALDAYSLGLSPITSKRATIRIIEGNTADQNKTIYGRQIVLSTNDQTKFVIPSSIAIKPNVEYTILIEFLQDMRGGNNYYNMNVYKEKVEMEGGVIIEFHKFKGVYENSVDRGIVTGMNFYEMCE